MASSCQSFPIPAIHENYPEGTINSNYWKCVETNGKGDYDSLLKCQEETQNCAQPDHHAHRFGLREVWPVAPFRYDSKRHLSPAFERLADTIVY
jgi:hypothetical protein